MAEQSRSGSFAFHGILPRGALEQAPELGLDREGWPWMGAFLECALGQGPVTAKRSVERGLRELEDRLGGLPRVLDSERAGRWLKAAGRIGLVSHAEGARLASAALRRWGARQARAWCVKEGHTASVWWVPPGSVPGAPALALLLPRDRIAECELIETSDELRRLQAILPGRVAREWRRDLLVREDGSLCSVVAMEWLAGSQELHLVGRGNRGAGSLVPVEAFLPAPPRRREAGQVASPSRSAPSSARLWHDVVVLWTRLCFGAPGEGPKAPSDFVMRPGFEINDGDFVLADGRVKVVACSRPTRMTARDAIASLVGTDAVDDGPAGWGRIAAGSAASTRAAVRDGLASCLAPELVRRLLGDPGEIDPEGPPASHEPRGDAARPDMTG